jgi:hypothetical protein
MPAVTQRSPPVRFGEIWLLTPAMDLKRTPRLAERPRGACPRPGLRNPPRRSASKIGPQPELQVFLCMRCGEVKITVEAPGPQC